MTQGAAAKVIIDCQKLTSAIEAFRGARDRHRLAVSAKDEAIAAERLALKELERAESDVNEVFDQLVGGED